MKKVSIIVPVYNTESYLEQCLDSLVNQTYQDIEIIVVNDESPDNSQRIIDLFVDRYPQIITCINQQNGGLSAARNTGLQHASGEYILFIDSDDFVTSTMVEAMVKKALEHDFDLVVCDCNYVFPDHVQRVNSGIDHDILSVTKEKACMNTLFPAAWNKLFHRRLFAHDITFTKGIWFEDVEFIYRLFPYINSIGVVKEDFYQYLQRKGAITSTFDERLFDYIKNWDTILTSYQRAHVYETYQKELEFSCLRYLYATFMKRAVNYQDEAMYWKAYETARTFVKKHFPHPWRNAYFYTAGAKGIYLLCFNRQFARLLYKKK